MRMDSRSPSLFQQLTLLKSLIGTWRKHRYSFENTAKIGSSYFQNFIGSQYTYDENGNKVENPNAYKPNAVRSMCCRLQPDLRELLKRGNGLFGSAEMTGSIGVVTINMARLGYLNKGNKAKLYSDLDRLLEISKATLEKNAFSFRKCMIEVCFLYKNVI